MKIGAQQKISKEELKANPDALLNAFNTLIQDFYNLVSKNINDDNTASLIKVLTVKTSSVYPTMEDVKFKSTLKTRAIGLTVLQCFNQTDSVPVETNNLEWIDSSGTIIISNVSGLQASKTYLLTVRII